MSEKNVSELLNIVRAGAGVTLEAHGLTADDVLPVAAAAAKADVPLRVRGAGALHWATRDLIHIAEAGKGHVIFE
jgi:hypothetical protein